MLSDFAMKAMNGVHRVILTVSGGRVGWSASNMPVLELTTTGRKSGEPRKVMLTSPLQKGDTIVVVASCGGDDQHPGWFLNLRDEPEVQVSFKGARPMRASLADAEQRARMWPVLAAEHENYAGCQTKTDREIPLVLLDPVS